MAGLEPSWNGDVALATLQPAAVFPELYEPLWWYSGSYAQTNIATFGAYLMQKGSTGVTTPSTGSTHLYTHNYPSSVQCSLEVCIWTSNASNTAEVCLWDFSLGTPAVVSGTTVTTTSTTATVIRSGKFTLTQGHVYGLAPLSTNTSYYTNITDASLIVFPSSPLTSPSVSGISLASPSGNSLKESYMPMWVHSSGNVNASVTTNNLAWVEKGSTGYLGGSSSSATKLLTLSSSWSGSQKFAFEASFWTSSGTGYIGLWDINTNTQVTQISTTSTTATLIRSATLTTLIPNHQYGVTIYGTGGTTYLTKAHLVALSS